MSKYRLLPLGLGVVLICCAALAAVAQDKDKGTGKGRPGKGGFGRGIVGRIANVNAEKRTIELKDLRGFGGGRFGKDKGRTTDKATTDKATTDKATTDKSTTKDRPGSLALRTRTFRVSADARITLDGKDATLKDLKTGQWARVFPAFGKGKDKGFKGGKDRGTATDKDKGTATGKDKGGRTGGFVMTVNRVDAYTKEPPRGGKGPRDKGLDKSTTKDTGK